MYLSCEEYYEKYLGDNCNNNCEYCYGRKEIYICKKEFEVCGESVIHKIKIEKDDWYWILSENEKRVTLICDDKNRLVLTRELFEKYFKN